MKAANKCFSVVGVPQLDFDQCNPDEMIQIVDAVQGIGQEPGEYHNWTDLLWKEDKWSK